MPCGKKPRKPLVPAKTLDIISRRRNVPNTQYYFTDRKHAIPPPVPGVETKRVRPFKIPRSEKLLSYIKYSDRKEKVENRVRLSQPLHLKDNLKIAATRDLSKRLFITESPDDVRAVVEIHPEFYRVIEGRPIRRTDDIKIYISNIRGFSMFRQQIGYRLDIILRIEKNTAEEAAQYETITANLKEHLKCFQIFLTEDYKKACRVVANAEKVTVKLIAKNSEFFGFVTQVTILSNILFKIDAIRSILKIYRNYLLFVAPLPWRQEFDKSLRGNLQSLQDIKSGIFIADNDLVESLDIDNLLVNAKSELEHPASPCLYFTKPQQMMYLFRSMELQSREYLNQHSKAVGPHRMLCDRIKQLKINTALELECFQYLINNINVEIERECFNEIELQTKFFRIINGPFYKTVASENSLKLKICIEYVYEQIFGKCEEGHVSLENPMKILEVTYENYNLRLDSLDFKIVTQAQKEIFAQDLKMMKNAYNAQTELRRFHEMTIAMNKAFLPPHKFSRPAVKKKDNKSRTAASTVKMASDNT